MEAIKLASWNWNNQIRFLLDRNRHLGVLNLQCPWTLLPLQLQEVLNIARDLINEIDAHAAPPDVEEKKAKLIQLKFVLEM